MRDDTYLSMLMHEERFMNQLYREDPLVKKALVIASLVHAREKTKRDEPYLEAHVYPIMAKAAPFGPDVVTVALLHDVVENSTFMNVDTLREAGFPERIVEAVDALSQRENESRSDYIQRVILNFLALLVKLLDNWWNRSQIARLAEVNYAAAQRLRRRYDEERIVLLQALSCEWLGREPDE